MAIPAATLAKALLILASAVYVLTAMRSVLPLIYDLRPVLAWLRPPYVYFIINGIIVSIVLSSRFQRDRLEKKLSGQCYPLVTANTPPPADLVAFAHPEFKSVAEASFEGPFVGESELNPAAVDGATVEFGEEKLGEGDVIIEKEAAVGKEIATEMACTDLKPTESESQLISLAAEKPLVSSHFAHRGKQSVKSSPEGGGRGLRVARQRKQLETLESTWKSITEGRSHVQLTRRLKKPDAPENREQSQSRRTAAADEVVAKRPSRSPGVMILRREPSLSQDELNRRVEAFIKKFNEEMRIQRQQSLQQYMETIKRRAN
ncbi:hypothetical protein DM860_002973 [Cuscuta australis]|uniref:DUF4408 domain-containing protein n=1 Tax=Cuscuta australis TaxID=267555 RepID=A0A328D2X8_9ASTE|nr:hypothetical protein DM860_002973 [Cuscuta australis]